MINQAIQEAKKMIEEYEKGNNNGPDHYLYDGEIECLQELIERLEALPQDDGWINVEDRLPDSLTRVLGIEGNWIDIVRNIDGKFYDMSRNEMILTHWQPLPPNP